MLQNFRLNINFAMRRLLQNALKQSLRCTKLLLHNILRALPRLFLFSLIVDELRDAAFAVRHPKTVNFCLRAFSERWGPRKFLNFWGGGLASLVCIQSDSGATSRCCVCCKTLLNSKILKLLY